MDFMIFKDAVARQFQRMQKQGNLFRVAVEKDQLYATYLASYPDGTNPMFRERTEHDCSCCKSFIRAIGDVVAIIDGKIETIWDIDVSKKEPAYQAVANGMAALVRGASIADVFLHYENKAGVDYTFEDLTTGGRKQWNHFFANIDRKFVVNGKDIASTIAPKRDAKNTLLRALKEIDLESADVVLELIDQNSVYRGQENRWAVAEFRKLKAGFDKLKTDADREIFVWTNSLTVSGAVSGIRNNAIGQLLQWIAEGMDIDAALNKFERTIMAPANYKRPTAPVTKKMIEEAKAKIESLGLTSALRRRFAQLTDISVNDILFANRNAKTVMTGDVFDELALNTSAKAKVSDKIEEISIDKFLTDVLPNINSMEVLLENRLQSNLVSLIAPEDPTAGQLFKWNNNFSLSYVGGMADSIKERVKAAGGSVEGDLCCRLAWEYTDDLDFHMKEPNGGHIYYASRSSHNGGKLDVDANGGNGMMAHPVENIFYSDRRTMAEGTYTLQVRNFSRRSDGKGFEIEIETYDGKKVSIVYDGVIRGSETMDIAKIKYSKATGFTIEPSLPSTQATKDMWGLPSQTFHPVNVMMMSPNFWNGEGIGNKHYLFMLDRMANNDGDARGFLNEFLKDELNPHRKVFEMVGSKIKVSGEDNQLSGLGFSSTQRNSVVVRVKGALTRTLKINF
jgi:hypothetical protein